MIHGDTLYHLWHGEIETATFLEESIVESASIPTWLCRGKDGRRFRCAVGMYSITEREAWARHLDECRAELSGIIRHRDECDKQIAEAVARIAEIEDKLKGM
jgi:hypothetical protein